MQKEIIIAERAGFCFGVKRAVDMVEQALSENKKPAYCLGHLIHNNQVVARLENKGLHTVHSLDEVPNNSLVVIRSHGTGPKIIQQAKERGIDVLDTTCPFVKNAQLTARQLQKDGYQVVICGDPNHAEVIAINAHIDDQGTIIAQADEVKQHIFSKPIGVMSQTTQKIGNVKQIVSALLDNGIKQLQIKNTICNDSTNKQNEVIALAPTVDVMVIVGGRSSSNTTKLAELSKKSGTPTYHIETVDELDPDWFREARKIGIAAGASTAQFLIDDIEKWLMNQ